MTCLYCGNGSGKLDTYGNCISCGAPHMDSAGEKVEPDYYRGYSGSSYVSCHIPMVITYMGHVIDGSILSVNEVRKMMHLPEISMEEYLLSSPWRYGIRV